ncbi:phosphotransferase [Streptomyces polyrhachis]|uniref:Phosphotransferase n=1 Tax=Streptomyces polyrhachis TaxID=1282885 RepID=A0ABW2GJH3_9ACTN
MERIAWHELPPAARVAVQEHVGSVLTATGIADGLTCQLAARLDAPGGPVFVKGVRVDDAHGSHAQRYEAAVAPLVVAVGARLRAVVTAAGWELLVFDWIDGRHADLSPGSPDLTAVADVLAAAQAIRAPDGLPVPQLADRLAPYLGAGGRELLRGEALLHTDTNPHNLLVGSGRAWMIDWAMVAAGPAWVDVAYTAVRLMEDGCSVVAALDWAGQFPAWRVADPAAVEALVGATCRRWESLVGADLARSSNARFEALAHRRGMLA